MKPVKNGKERRRSPRKAKTLSVRIGSRSFPVSKDLDAGDFIEAPGKNIGMGGLCFISPHPVDTGRELDLTIRIADWDPDALGRSLYVAVSSIPIVARARVVRCDPNPAGDGYEVGVAFTELCEQDKKTLEKFLGRAD